MASKDLHSNIHAVTALEHTTFTANGAAEGAIIDTNGYRSLEFLILSGNLTDGTYTPKLMAGDASDMSDGVEVTAALGLLGTIAGATIASTEDDTVKRLGYVGGRRYVQLVVTGSVITTGGDLSAIAVLGHPWVVPVP